MEDTNTSTNCCTLSERQVKEMLFSTTPIYAKQYIETVCKNNSENLYTSGMKFLFEKLEKSMIKGDLQLVIEFDKYGAIQEDERNWFYLQPSMVYFLEYLGYDVNLVQSRSGIYRLYINPFKDKFKELYGS